MPIYARQEDMTDLDSEEDLTLPENATPEETTYAKRYADLRRFTAKLQTEISGLKNELKAGVAQGMNIPSADDEKALDAWLATYPDISKVVSTLVRRVAKRETEHLEGRVQALDKQEHDLKIERAQHKLAEEHPDFFGTIRVDPEFDEWLSTKSKPIQDALRENDYDWKAAVDVVTMYKHEKGLMKNTKPKPKGRDLADLPRTRNNANQPPTMTGMLFSESQIDSMSPQEYEEMEAEIDKAARQGKILRDLSAGAR